MQAHQVICRFLHEPEIHRLGPRGRIAHPRGQRAAGGGAYAVCIAASQSRKASIKALRSPRAGAQPNILRKQARKTAHQARGVTVDGALLQALLRHVHVRHLPGGVNPRIGATRHRQFHGHPQHQGQGLLHRALHRAQAGVLLAGPAVKIRAVISEVQAQANHRRHHPEARASIHSEGASTARR